MGENTHSTTKNKVHIKISGALIQFVERNWGYAMETRDVNTHLCGNQILFLNLFRLLVFSLNWKFDLKISRLLEHNKIDIEWCCFMGYSEIASWCGFPPYWRPWDDFVDLSLPGQGIWYQSNIFLLFYQRRNKIKQKRKPNQKNHQ
jgi:hypothetical protein